MIRFIHMFIVHCSIELFGQFVYISHSQHNDANQTLLAR